MLKQSGPASLAGLGCCPTRETCAGWATSAPCMSTERGCRGTMTPAARWPATGSPPSSALVDRIIGELVGIVAIGMAAGDAEDPLADQVLGRVPNLLRRPFIHQTPGDPLDQAIHPLGYLAQHGAAIGTRLLTVDGGD